jgi:branched-chain amino acid transport system ATP-binding protein
MTANPAAASGTPIDGSTATLSVEEIHTYYGNIHAIKGLSLTVNAGEIVTLIGANGAGKSTTLKTISGLLKPRSGVVRFNNERIDPLPPHRVVELGISQSPEGRRIFAKMTVRENLEMGAFARRNVTEIEEDLERVLTLFPRLRERLKQRGGTLSGGEQQMLAIGRAMMARPRVLLLDEPSMGLSPVLVDTIFDTIVDINRQGTTILLVEQNAHMALAVAARGYVLESGRVVAADSAKALAESELVRKTYLGEE